MLGCSSESPITLELPEDLEGPISGASPQSDEPLELGQSAVDWTGRGGSLEMRWPIAMEYSVDPDSCAPMDAVMFALV